MPVFRTPYQWEERRISGVLSDEKDLRRKSIDLLDTASYDAMSLEVLLAL